MAVAVEASASPLKYIMMLGPLFPSITIYFNGDADTDAAA